MTDDPTGLALREHLDSVLADVVPHSSLLDGIRADYDRRMRRRAAVLAGGSALTAAAATATVLVVSNVGTADRGVSPGTEPSPSASPTASPTYPPPQPSEKWFTEPDAFGRPTSEIATFPLAGNQGDPANSQRTLLVWYSATKSEYCVHDILQSPDDPHGDHDNSSGGGCTFVPASGPRHTNFATMSRSCDTWRYVFGVVAADTAKVVAQGVGGPSPEVTILRLGGAPAPVFLVANATAPKLVFRYLNAAGDMVRYQVASQPAGDVVACGPGIPTPTPTPTPIPTQTSNPTLTPTPTPSG